MTAHDPASPSVAPESTPTANGAESGAQDLRERFENRLRWHFNVVAEDGKGSSYIGLGIENALLDLDRFVREHTERAWDEGANAAVEPVNTGTRMTLRAVLPFPTNPYRAARQEQDR